VTAQVILPGDKVATWKDTFFLHPMIHVGNGWFVEKAKTGQVRPRHHSTLPAGEPLKVMQRPRPHDAPRVVQRAMSRLGWEPYDVLQSNCQHFANEVLNGERKSEQVEALKAIALGALAGLAIVALLSK
jgi:hypothetical protein